jgi:hypothetical protein
MPRYDKKQYSLLEMYAVYTKSCVTPVTFKVFKTILELWGSEVNASLLEGKDVRLYHGMSSLGVRKKEKPFYVDKKVSRELKTKVVRPNTHSGGYGARIMWKRHYTIMNSQGWEFEPSRKLSRGLAAVMKMPGGHTNFVQRAMVTRDLESARSVYNKKVHKI